MMVLCAILLQHEQHKHFEIKKPAIRGRGAMGGGGTSADDNIIDRRLFFHNDMLDKNCSSFSSDSAYSLNLYLARQVWGFFFQSCSLHHSVGVDKRIKKM